MCGGRCVGAEVIMESILVSSELEARRKKRRENRGPVEIARRNWFKQMEVKNGGKKSAIFVEVKNTLIMIMPCHSKGTYGTVVAKYELKHFRRWY